MFSDHIRYTDLNHDTTSSTASPTTSLSSAQFDYDVSDADIERAILESVDNVS